MQITSAGKSLVCANGQKMLWYYICMCWMCCNDATNKHRTIENVKTTTVSMARNFMRFLWTFTNRRNATCSYGRIFKIPCSGDCTFDFSQYNHCSARQNPVRIQYSMFWKQTMDHHLIATISKNFQNIWIFYTVKLRHYGQEQMPKLKGLWGQWARRSALQRSKEEIGNRNCTNFWEHIERHHIVRRK